MATREPSSELLQVTASDRASQLVAPGFDPVALELYPFLSMGASIHVVPDDVRAMTSDLLGFIAKNRISIALLPTPIAGSLAWNLVILLLSELAIEHKWPAESRLRVLYTGGDKLHRGAHP